jgi:redox-sensitive bicupin YhaK (pirin superfamily)
MIKFFEIINHTFLYSTFILYSKVSIMKKSLIKIIEAVSMSEGMGARVNRSFPTQKLSYVDPFVLMDDFFVQPPAGFPEHPHRGFEAITYMLEGGFSHEDTSGTKAKVMQGGVQRITMGKGLKHSEMPVTQGLNRGIQLWVNLPQNLKDVNPSYETYESEKLPLTRKNNSVIKTIIGKGSPVKLNTDVEYYDIKLSESNFNWSVDKDKNSYIYVISGQGSIDSDSESNHIESGSLALKSEKSPLLAKISTQKKINFILLIGKPHNEPIYQHGPFVD